MKTNKFTLLLITFWLLLMSAQLNAQASQVIYNNPQHTSGSLTLLAADCYNPWWSYSWNITVPANVPIKFTTELNYAARTNAYHYTSGMYQEIFYGEAPSTSTVTTISTTGSIYVYCYDQYGMVPSSNVFSITFEVDSAIYSQTHNVHVPGKLSVMSGLDVYGNTSIDSRLGIGSNSSVSKVYVYNYNQDNNALTLYSSRTSTSSLYGLNSSATNRNGNVYGIYSTVTGVTGKKWSGYFTGGDVAIMSGNTGIGVNDPKGILQVRGTLDNSWIYFSPNAGTSTTTKYKPKVNYGLAFTWNYSGGHGESIINYSTETGSSPRLDFTSYNGTDLTTEMTLKGGSLGIGTSVIPTDFKLAVAGKIIAEEVVVKLQSAWPDFVFHQDYQLKPLHEVEQFVRTNKHLPGIPSAAQVEEKGLSMGEMQNKLLLKIEELTLYIIAQDKKIKTLEDKLK